MGKTARVTAAVTLSTVLCCSLAGGDTAAIPHLDTVVVTPDRSATSIRASTVAVNALPGSLIRALPFRSVGDALAIVPGIAVVDASSLGGNPRIIARGFYGGGETDYVSAQIDGVPVAALGSGAVDWSMLPLEGLSRLELVRGATSYLHGDAAVGVNATIWRGLTTSAIASSQSGAFVDDQNLVPLGGFTRLDSRIGIPFGRARVTIDLINALDRRYDATAFPDPAGSTAVYRYPAAGRVLIVGLESR